MLTYADNLLALAKIEKGRKVGSITFLTGTKSRESRTKNPQEEQDTDGDRNPHKNFTIVKYSLQTTHKLLGTYLTRDLNRKKTVKERVKTTSSATRTLLPFAERNKLEWKTLKQIYNTILLPTMTYGARSAATSKAKKYKI